MSTSCTSESVVPGFRYSSGTCGALLSTGEGGIAAFAGGVHGW